MATKVPSMIVVQKYIESYQLPIELASGVLKCETDCEEFHKGFYLSNKRLVDDLLDFREHKIQQANTTLEDFLSRCVYQRDILQEVFESIFIQKFTTTDIDFILSAVLSEETSFEILFLGFLKNPNKNILQYVL